MHGKHPRGRCQHQFPSLVPAEPHESPLWGWARKMGPGVGFGKARQNPGPPHYAPEPTWRPSNPARIPERLRGRKRSEASVRLPSGGRLPPHTGHPRQRTLTQPLVLVSFSQVGKCQEAATKLSLGLRTSEGCFPSVLHSLQSGGCQREILRKAA